MNPKSDDDSVDLLARRLDEHCRSGSSLRRGSHASSINEELPNELRQRFERILSLADEIDSLANPAHFDQPSLVGKVFGRYEILGVQGIGAFGVVYRAYDPNVLREVALKVPRAEMLFSIDARRRFLQEAQAAARLDHLHIAAVLESGEVEGIPYIVSAFCTGPTLAQWMKAHPEGVESAQAIDILLPLAEAIAHAHGRGVLHRDIKPSNVLMVPAGGTLDTSAPFVPKITDFGLAKLTESTPDQTRTGAIIGTVRYMAPEQAAGRVREISTASDIYSLGMILYELLTGKTAFEAETDIASLTRIQIDEVAPLRSQRRNIGRDIEAVCMKCLEKRPADRYPSALALADDLRRVKRGEPTIARPLKRSEQAVRWIRRRPVVAAFAAVTLVSVITTLAGGAWYSYRLADSLAETQQALTRAKESEQHSAYLLYAADMKLAGEALARHDTGQVKQLLSRHMPEAGKEDPRNFIWHYLSRSIHEEPIESTRLDSNIYCQAVSSDGRLLVMGDAGGKIHLHDTDPFRDVSQIDSGQGEVNGIAVNASGDRIATAGKDGTVKIWNRGESMPAHTVPACTKGQAYAVAFVRSGDVVVTGGEDPAIRFWSAVNGRLLKEIVGNHVDWIESIGASPNGKTIIVVDSRANILVYDSTTFEQLGSRQADLIGRASVAQYSPDGKRIAVIGSGTGVLLLDAMGNPDSYVPVSAHRKEAIAWNEDGSKLFVGERSGAVRVFSVPKVTKLGLVEQRRLDDPARLPKLIDTWQAHPGRIWSLAYLPRTKQLISTSDKSDMVRWDLLSSTGWTAVPPSDKHRAKQSYLFSRDGKTAIYNDPSKCASLNPETLEFMKSTNHDFFAYTNPALHPNGQLIAFARYGLDLPVDARILIHRTDDLSELVRWDIPSFKGDIQVAFSKDVKYLGAAFESRSNTFHLLDTQTLKTLKQASFSNLGMKLRSTAIVDGHDCFIIHDQNDVIALRCRDLAVLWRFEAHHFGIAATILSPDGNVLYTAGGDGLIKSWDLITRRLLHAFSGEHLGVTKLSISSDSQVLVSLAAGEHQLRVWDCRTHQQVTSIKAPGDVPITNIDFMPDGRRLIVLREEHEGLVLDTR